LLKLLGFVGFAVVHLARIGVGFVLEFIGVGHRPRGGLIQSGSDGHLGQPQHTLTPDVPGTDFANHAARRDIGLVFRLQHAHPMRVHRLALTGDPLHPAAGQQLLEAVVDHAQPVGEGAQIVRVGDRGVVFGGDRFGGGIGPGRIERRRGACLASEIFQALKQDLVIPASGPAAPPRHPVESPHLSRDQFAHRVAGRIHRARRRFAGRLGRCLAIRGAIRCLQATISCGASLADGEAQRLLKRAEFLQNRKQILIPPLVQLTKGLFRVVSEAAGLFALLAQLLATGGESLGEFGEMAQDLFAEVKAEMVMEGAAAAAAAKTAAADDDEAEDEAPAARKSSGKSSGKSGGGFSGGSGGGSAGGKGGRKSSEGNGNA